MVRDVIDTSFKSHYFSGKQTFLNICHKIWVTIIIYTTPFSPFSKWVEKVWFDILIDKKNIEVFHCFLNTLYNLKNQFQMLWTYFILQLEISNTLRNWYSCSKNECVAFYITNNRGEIRSITSAYKHFLQTVEQTVLIFKNLYI